MCYVNYDGNIISEPNIMQSVIKTVKMATVVSEPSAHTLGQC